MQQAPFSLPSYHSSNNYGNYRRGNGQYDDGSVQEPANGSMQEPFGDDSGSMTSGYHENGGYFPYNSGRGNASSLSVMRRGNDMDNDSSRGLDE